MPLYDAACLAAAVLAVALLMDRARMAPFLALTAGALLFAVADRLSLGHMSKAFGTGFAQSLQAVGLAVVAGALMSAITAGTGAQAWLARRAGGAGSPWAIGLIGLVAGAGYTPAVVLAVLDPLRRALTGGSRRAAAVLGVTLAAGQGLLLPSPAVIAAMSILGADWMLVLAYGVPAAALAALAAGAYAARAMPDEAPPAPAQPPTPAAPRVAAVLVLVSAVLAGLLLVQAFAELPSEPLGGGGVRERMIGLGRPLTLLAVGVGALLLAAFRFDREALSEEGWVGRGIVTAAPLVLLVGAAGGLQTLNQQPGMAELLAEAILGWKIGLALPFALAAIVKLLQGSTLVAALTASGMLAGLLPSLGLDTEAGRALAALAVGAGSVTASHINDPHFWLTSRTAALSATTSLRVITLATALAGSVGLAVLAAMGAVAG